MSAVPHDVWRGLLLAVRVIVALAVTASILTVLLFGVVYFQWFDPLPPIESIWSWAATGKGDGRYMYTW